MTKKVYSDILKMAGAILGVFLYAAAFRIILVPLNLYSGGFTGISQVLMTLLEKIFHITFPTGIDFTGIFLSGYSIFRFSFLPGKQSAAHFS